MFVMDKADHKSVAFAHTNEHCLSMFCVIAPCQLNLKLMLVNIEPSSGYKMVGDLNYCLLRDSCIKWNIIKVICN